MWGFERQRALQVHIEKRGSKMVDDEGADKLFSVCIFCGYMCSEATSGGDNH